MTVPPEIPAHVQVEYRWEYRPWDDPNWHTTAHRHSSEEAARASFWAKSVRTRSIAELRLVKYVTYREVVQ